MYFIFHFVQLLLYVLQNLFLFLFFHGLLLLFLQVRNLLICIVGRILSDVVCFLYYPEGPFDVQGLVCYEDSHDVLVILQDLLYLVHLEDFLLFYQRADVK